MPNPPDYYKNEDPAKTALRNLLIKEGNKILKETNRKNFNNYKVFICDTLAYLKMDVL
jgi:hypothetical protein